MAQGLVVVLNGIPRSGKSTLARALQESGEGVWLNLGVDAWIAMTPERFRPGLGLRPDAGRPDLEAIVGPTYRALFASIAAHAAEGLNVVADLGLHDAYAQPQGVLRSCAAALQGHRAYLVGVRCPLDEVMRRREATGWTHDEAARQAVERWDQAVHNPGIYDLEIDTSRLAPADGAAQILARIASASPTAIRDILAAPWPSPRPSPTQPAAGVARRDST